MTEAEEVQSEIERFHQKVGVDVHVKCRWMNGIHHKDKWYAETSKFRVGPEDTLADVLEQLESLHDKSASKKAVN